MLRVILYFVSLVLLIEGCSKEAEKIEYGFDHCRFCEMTIVDRSHAAVLVTEKGKTYKFDSIECMIRFYKREKQTAYAHILVADYLNPGNLISADSACFLISENIPSPMGGNLSALTNEDDCTDLKKRKGGEVYYWNSVLDQHN